MSRHSNRYSSYEGDYDVYYDDTRDHRLSPSSRDLPDPERYGTKYRAVYSDQRDPRYDPRDHHIQPLSRDLNKWVPTDPGNHFSRNSCATYPHEGLARSELRRGLATSSEPSDRRCKKPVRNQRMDFPLADPLFKRASLHVGKPGLARTSFPYQDTKALSTNRRQLGGVGQMSPRHVRQNVKCLQEIA